MLFKRILIILFFLVGWLGSLFGYARTSDSVREGGMLFISIIWILIVWGLSKKFLKIRNVDTNTAIGMGMGMMMGQEPDDINND